MKQLTEYTRASGYLVKIFGYLNEVYFDNTLSKPVITIQSTPRAYGHVSVSKVWETEKGAPRHELNIGAGTLSRPIENIVATMLHEMVHIYCLQNNIKDTSRGYAYHNKRFKEEAEKRDLHIDHDPRIGYSITSPTDNLLAFCLRFDLEDIQLNRTEGFRAIPPTNGGTPSPTFAPPRKPLQVPENINAPDAVAPSALRAIYFSSADNATLTANASFSKKPKAPYGAFCYSLHRVPQLVLPEGFAIKDLLQSSPCYNAKPTKPELARASVGSTNKARTETQSRCLKTVCKVLTPLV